MTAKSVLMHHQGLRPEARAPTCPPYYATGRCKRLIRVYIRIWSDQIRIPLVVVTENL